jgi:type IV fimbrial biogenesis protein FimT
MRKRVLLHALVGGKILNKESGTTLLELMAVILILAIMASISMPLLYQQIAAREIETIARRFISHAQFARHQALYTGSTVHIAPMSGDLWDQGWVVKTICRIKQTPANCIERNWFSQGDIAPVYFKGGGKQFMDPHTSKRGIAFNAAGAAKTGQGGFVANRLILGHDRDSNLERHLILSSGGRWRICDPKADSKACR